MDALERVKELNRADSFQELKSSTDMVVSLVTEKYSSGFVANELKKILSQIGVFNPQIIGSQIVSHFQDITLNLSNGKELLVYNNMEFGTWANCLLNVQNEYGVKYVARSDSYFGTRVRNIRQQCDLAYLYADKCRESGVDGHVVQLRLNRISDINLCMKKVEGFLE
ncbi:hypothetical protein [Chromobacterium haemolyticum]|uniref:hypothetical protein n=2 Tax=Chromobacterium TaxID=535 RepID=UPI002953486E|nr:hypothetical protein [Chromobacterium haemolyticum]WON83252.1 hypothetical protein OK026_19285 [Chromobacterium haemolyticum]